MNRFNLFVSTTDQIRTNGLFQFMIDFIKEYTKGSTQLYLTIIIIGALIAGLLIYGKKLEQPLLIIYIITTIIISVIGLMVLPKRGLHIKNDAPDPSIPLAVQELRKGWLLLIVSAIVGLLMGLLGSYIEKLVNFG